MTPFAEVAQRYRSEFAVTETLADLNHAAAGALSRSVSDALRRFSDDIAQRGSEASEEWVVRSETTREKVARFIGATHDEIAFMKNTPDGINAVSNGIEWRTGD